MYKFIIPIILIILVLLVLAKNIVIVQQSRAYVVERLGAFQAVWGVGIHLKIPFIERVARKVSLKEQIADFPPQPVITKDNVTIQVDTVLFFQITDPKLYAYGVEHPMAAIENLTATTLRNLIGDLELDQSLTSRDIINAKMRVTLGHQGQSGGAEEHHAAQRDSGRHGEADEGRTGTSGSHPPGRRSEAEPDPGGRRRKAVPSAPCRSC